MHPTARAVLGAAAGLLAGLLLGFFFVFRTLFTDGPAALLHPEYLLAHGLNLVAYAAAAALLVRFASLPAVAWLVAPAALACLLYMDPSWGLRLLTLAGALLGGALGAWAGTAWRRRSRSGRSGPPAEA